MSAYRPNGENVLLSFRLVIIRKGESGGQIKITATRVHGPLAARLEAVMRTSGWKATFLVMNPPQKTTAPEMITRMGHALCCV